MKALFDQHLAHYRQEIEQRTASLDVVEKIKNLRQFDMLALYLCRGKTPEEIGKLPGLGWKEKSVSYRDIKRAAELVVLPMKKHGRPRNDGIRPVSWLASLQGESADV